MKKAPHFHLPTYVTKPGLKWAIGFDKNTALLLAGDEILDPDEQMRVCDLLCRLGLAKHRMVGESYTQTSSHQENYYAASKKMRKLL